MINNSKFIIREFYDFKASEKLIKESEERGKPLIMTGILQKADVENRNGRIYPYAILKREVEKYMELVENNTAGGECDHPDCQLPDSQILTSGGWKYLPEIAEDEEILTLNTATGAIETQVIEKKIDQAYRGKMYHLKSRIFDSVVTPNHRFWIEDKNGKGFFKTAKELFENRINTWRIPKTGLWAGEEQDYFSLPGLKKFKERTASKLIEKYSEDLKIKSEDWFAFVGIYLSEGSSYGIDGGSQTGKYEVKITQKVPEKKEKIKALLQRLPFVVKIYEKEGGKTDYVIFDMRLHNYLFPLGNSHKKYIPAELKKSSPRLLSILIDWFHLGDGRLIFQKNRPNPKKEVFSTSLRLIEDLQEILVKAGGHGNIKKYAPVDRWINDVTYIDAEVESGGVLELVRQEIKTKRLIKAENSKTLYFLNFSHVKYVSLNKKCLKIEKKEYDGRVYCVRVPNGTFYTMRNGKSSWTGNSAVVSLEKTSHRIINMWWEGKDLYGKVLIAEETPAGKILKGLLKAGFTLGISSRGVGSVITSPSGADIVQEDFELIAFDFVSSPSTPGAYLFREGKEIFKRGMIPFYPTATGHLAIAENPEKLQEEYNQLTSLFNLVNKDFWKKI